MKCMEYIDRHKALFNRHPMYNTKVSPFEAIASVFKVNWIPGENDTHWNLDLQRNSRYHIEFLLIWALHFFISPLSWSIEHEIRW